jgi:hypothetical protein
LNRNSCPLTASLALVLDYSQERAYSFQGSPQLLLGYIRRQVANKEAWWKRARTGAVADRDIDRNVTRGAVRVVIEPKNYFGAECHGRSEPAGEEQEIRHSMFDPDETIAAHFVMEPIIEGTPATKTLCPRTCATTARTQGPSPHAGIRQYGRVKDGRKFGKQPLLCHRNVAEPAHSSLGIGDVARAFLVQLGAFLVPRSILRE